MEKIAYEQLVEEIGQQRAQMYVRESEALIAHIGQMRELMNALLPNARILLINNSDRAAEQKLELMQHVTESQMEFLAASEGATRDTATTAHRHAAVFGLSLDDPRLTVWNAATETPVVSLDAIDAILITGSAANVTDVEETPWMQRVAAVLRQAYEMDIPTLGICFGHQILAHALGGSIDWMTDADGNQVSEIGPAFAWYTEEGLQDPLFAGLRDEREGKSGFTVQAIHSQQITTLPANTTLLATNVVSPVQALRYKNKRIWSLQNHPENSAMLTDVRIAGDEASFERRFEGVSLQTRALLGHTTYQEWLTMNCTIPTSNARTILFANFLQIVAEYVKEKQAASAHNASNAASTEEVESII